MKCIRDESSGTILRVCDANAEDMVTRHGPWEYCNKAAWKNYVKEERKQDKEKAKDIKKRTRQDRKAEAKKKRAAKRHPQKIGEVQTQ